MIRRLLIGDGEVDLGAAIIGLECECACEFANCQRILAELHQHGAQRAVPLGYIGCELDYFFKLLSGSREVTILFCGVTGMEGCIGCFKVLLPVSSAARPAAKRQLIRRRVRTGICEYSAKVP